MTDNELDIDVDRMVDFLVGLLETPSPTGDANRAIEYIKDGFATASLGIELVTTPKGTLVGTLSGRDSDSPRAVTAHADTLGAMVQRVKENGRLGITQLGSWLWTSVEGEGLTIFASNGERYRGTIMPTAVSVHAHKRDDLKVERNGDNMEIRIDADTSSADETRALGIEVGDYISFDPRVEVPDTGYIRSRHLDDKAGVAAVYGALTALAESGKAPAQRTTIHISTFEEVGHGGAAGFPDDLAELLVVDMAVVAPKQRCDEKSVGICAKDAAGPYHTGMRRRLERLAKDAGIRYRTDVYPHYTSDGTAYWRAGGNVSVALIGPGVDASHHYERTHRDALKHSAHLIAAYLLN